MADINPKRAAIALGSFAALVHAVWSAAVAAGFGQALLDWRLGMHFLNVPVTVSAFNPATAVGLVVLAFAGGAVVGFVFAKVWNWAARFK